MEKNTNGKKDHLEFILSLILCAAALAGLLVANIGVFSRQFKISISWTDEVLRALFVWVYFLCGGLTAKTGFLSISLLEETLRDKGRNMGYHAVKILHSLLSLVFAAYCTFYGYQAMSGQFALNQKSTILGFPQGCVTLGFVVGCAFWAYYEIINIVKHITSKDQ